MPSFHNSFKINCKKSRQKPNSDQVRHLKTSFNLKSKKKKPTSKFQQLNQTQFFHCSIVKRGKNMGVYGNSKATLSENLFLHALNARRIQGHNEELKPSDLMSSVT